MSLLFMIYLIVPSTLANPRDKLNGIGETTGQIVKVKTPNYKSNFQTIEGKTRTCLDKA
jgi:hypothetical protein